MKNALKIMLAYICIAFECAWCVFGVLLIRQLENVIINILLALSIILVFAIMTCIGAGALDSLEKEKNNE